MQYHARFVHAIAPKPHEYSKPFKKPHTNSSEDVLRRLRQNGIHVGRISSSRVGNDGTMMLFPFTGGYYTKSNGSIGIYSSSSIWSCVIVEPCNDNCKHDSE